MSIYYFSTVILAFGLVVAPCPAFSTEINNRLGSKLEAVIEKIQTKEKSVQTFVAKFVQVKQSRLLKKPLYSEGSIYFDRAGKMLWKTTKPSPLSVLIINDHLYLDYPDMGKSQKRKVGTPAGLLKKYFGLGQSMEALEELYEIDLSNGKTPNRVSLKLVPKRKTISKRIEAIEVVINTKNWLPEKVSFKEAKGDYTSLQLYFTLMNTVLPEGTFLLPSGDGEKSDFQIPKGKGGEG